MSLARRVCVLPVRNSRGTRVISCSVNEEKAKVSFQVRHQRLFGSSLMLMGGCSELGHFNFNHSVALHWNDGDKWTAQVDLPTGTSVRYKYAKVAENPLVIRWKSGSDLVVEIPAGCSDARVFDTFEGEEHVTTFDRDEQDWMSPSTMEEGQESGNIIPLPTMREVSTSGEASRTA